jgi:hypothetical protein
MLLVRREALQQLPRGGGDAPLRVCCVQKLYAIPAPGCDFSQERLKISVDKVPVLIHQDLVGSVLVSIVLLVLVSAELHVALVEV